MHDKNFIQVAGNTRTDYFDVQRQTRKDGLPIMLPMRNKVLPVLLAAGMLATMPATTAVNVLADSSAEETIVGATTTEYVPSGSWSWDFASKTATYTVTVTTKDATHVYVIKSDGNQNFNVVDEITKAATCTTDGQETLKATIKADNFRSLIVSTIDGKVPGANQNTVDSYNDLLTALNTLAGKDDKGKTKDLTANSGATTIKGQHVYNYTTGTWKFTKTGKDANGAPTWSATCTVSCTKHTPAVEKTFDATVELKYADQSYKNCISPRDAYYIASFKGDDGQTYYCTAKDFSKLTYSSTDANANETATTTAPSKDDHSDCLKYGYKLGHTWEADGNFVWPTSYTDDYLAEAAKAGTANDHYGYIFSIEGSYTNTWTQWNQNRKIYNVADNKIASDELQKKEEPKVNHNQNVYLAVKCTSSNHDKEKGDGEAEVYVPAFVVVDYDAPTCTEDATTTYYAYVFKDYDDIKTQMTDLAEKVNAKKDKISADTLYDAAKTFFDANQKDATMNPETAGYVSYSETKTDTWKNTALGHKYDLVDWKWDADKSEVTMRLRCAADDKYLTAQSTSVKKNADGKTATVTYTAKDARKYTNVSWIGKDGYYLDQTKNPYGQAITVTVPLSDAKGVAMYRLYKPSTGEHFYTADTHEVAVLVASREWNNEGIGWYAPSASNTPVYRVYNSKTGEHVFTKNAVEKKSLIAAGWNDEGIAFYSDDAQGVAVYRQFNPNAASSVASHNFTKDAHENTVLTTQYGWKAEGIAWYGLAE